MLSDACSEFVGQLKDAKSDADKEAAIDELTKEFDRYRQQPPFDYSTAQLQALETALMEGHHSDAGQRWLVILAEAIRHYHDTSPSTGAVCVAQYLHDRGEREYAAWVAAHPRLAKA